MIDECCSCHKYYIYDVAKLQFLKNNYIRKRRYLLISKIDATKQCNSTVIYCIKKMSIIICYLAQL